MLGVQDAGGERGPWDNGGKKLKRVVGRGYVECCIVDSIVNHGNKKSFLILILIKKVPIPKEKGNKYTPKQLYPVKLLKKLHFILPTLLFH